MGVGGDRQRVKGEAGAGAAASLVGLSMGRKESRGETGGRRAAQVSSAVRVTFPAPRAHASPARLARQWEEGAGPGGERACGWAGEAPGVELRLSVRPAVPPASLSSSCHSSPFTRPAGSEGSRRGGKKESRSPPPVTVSQSKCERERKSFVAPPPALYAISHPPPPVPKKDARLRSAAEPPLLRACWFLLSK